MESFNEQCSNCQKLETAIQSASSSVQKLMTLKSKIINTDALIRQYKTVKDENELLMKDNKRLLDEREKTQSQCAKYEIDLKLALEELHSLRQSEKDLKTSSSKFQSEVSSLHESLQAEKALVKQYKSLVEKDHKAEDQARDRLIRDFERRLSKKDDDIQKSRDKTQKINRRLNFLSKSCIKALKLLQKFENQPGFADHLPVSDRKGLKDLSDLLHKNEPLFGAALDNHSNEEENILDESQYLENLLMESVPTENGSDGSSTFTVNHKNFNNNTVICLQDLSVHKEVQNSMPEIISQVNNQSLNNTTSDGVQMSCSSIIVHNRAIATNLLPNSETNCDQKSPPKSTKNVVQISETNCDQKSLPESTANDVSNHQNCVPNGHIDVGDNSDLVCSLPKVNGVKEDVPVSMNCIGGKKSEVPGELPMHTDVIECKVSGENENVLGHVKLIENKSNVLTSSDVCVEMVTVPNESENSVAANALPETSVSCVSNQGIVTECSSEGDSERTDQNDCENVSGKSKDGSDSVAYGVLNSLTPCSIHGLNQTSGEQAEEQEIFPHPLEVCDASVRPSTKTGNSTADLVEDKKASANGTHIESEYEDGDLVIVSDSEAGTLEPSKEENKQNEVQLQSQTDAQIGEAVSPGASLKCQRAKGVDESNVPNELEPEVPDNSNLCAVPSLQQEEALSIISVCSDKALGGSIEDEETSKTVFSGSSEFSLPSIPFSEDRQFQPRSSSKSCVPDTSSLSKDQENHEGRRSHHRKTRKTRSKVDQIFCRMKNSLIPRCPVSPLPPSPPMTPLMKEPPGMLDSNVSDFNKNVEEPNMCDLFGFDSNDENDDSSNQNAKSTLQHQESEGFDPEMEHQDEVPRRNEELDQREVLRSIGHKTRESDVQEDPHDDRIRYPNEDGQNGKLLPVRGRSKSFSDRNNNRFSSNSRLFTDFRMDPGSGRCKISIHLPDSLTSATSVRFELDTSSKELHLDYGPSEFSDWNNSSKLNSNPLKRGSCVNKSLTPGSPTITLPDDSPCESVAAHSRSSNAQTTITEVTPTPSLIRPVRRVTVPPLGNSLKKQALPRRSLMLGTRNKTAIDISSDEPSPNSCEETQVSNGYFKMPTLKRHTLASQHRNGRVSSSGTLMSSRLESPSDGTAVASTDEPLMSPMSPPLDSNSSQNETIDVVNSVCPNNETAVGVKNGKRKHDQAVAKGSSKKSARIVTASPSDSTVQKHTKLSKSIEGCQIETNPQILKAFKPLQKIKLNNSQNPALFTKLFQNLCKPNLSLTPEHLVAASLFVFSRSTLDILPQFPKKKLLNLPLLGVKEEAFIALMKHLQEKMANMDNLINIFLSTTCEQLNRTDKVCPTGLASLCRLHTVICRQEGYTQAAQDLCYQFILRKHPHAAYLIANALVVWPTVLELSSSMALLKMRKKVLSLLLFGTVSEEFDQTARILKDVGDLESPGPDCQPDALAKEILELLMSKVDVSASEDMCQQLLLLSYTQGWPWTKDTVLPLLWDVLASVSSSVKTPIVRLIGSFLHYCGPKGKEDSDLLVQKLQTFFRELDDSDFHSKESCIHNLLPLSSQLEDPDVSQMKSWLQTNRSKLSLHLIEDFVQSGFLS